MLCLDNVSAPRCLKLGEKAGGSGLVPVTCPLKPPHRKSPVINDAMCEAVDCMHQTVQYVLSGQMLRERKKTPHVTPSVQGFSWGSALR